MAAVRFATHAFSCVPCVCCQGYQISRIRKFYMRKIKFTQVRLRKARGVGVSTETAAGSSLCLCSLARAVCVRVCASAVL